MLNLIENLTIVPLENYLNQHPSQWDVLIASGSFEERCIRSSEIFHNNNIKIRKSIIFNFQETDPENKKEFFIKIIKSNLYHTSNEVHIFDAPSVSHPKNGIKKFFNFVEKNDVILSDRKIIIDITVIPKAYFFLLIKVLKEKYDVKKIDIIYTEPEKYSNSQEGKIILTEGLDRIESIPGFSGSSVYSKDALIVFLGFEGNRSLEVFHFVNPDITYAINGFPSYKPGWHKISLEANMRFLKLSGASNNLFFAPAIDPFDNKNVLYQIIEDINRKNEKMNIIIAPLGTKMQALGVLLLGLYDASVKVIYPFPSVYKADYSHKYGLTNILKINLM